mgnify:CR=1 FL=1|jgi:hypothetical protein
MKKLNTEIVTEEKIRLLEPYHRPFQGIVSIIANLHFNILDAQAIMKYEGGIVVNKREIVLYNNQVKDDFKPHSNEGSKEEIEVARVIEKIFSEMKFEILPNSLENWFNKETTIITDKKLKTFNREPYGNQLVSFFEK